MTNIKDVEELIDEIRCATFHHSDEEAKVVIDEYLEKYRYLLDSHDRAWYYKFC
jgi:hypothetical protein